MTDFQISDGHYYIVTGANMAGKSTFLRSVGINYILALCGLPVFANHLKVSRFSLFSSMRTTDDLAHGISYFNAELLRLKQLIGYCKQNRHTLIILDEIPAKHIRISCHWHHRHPRPRTLQDAAGISRPFPQLLLRDTTF